MPKNQIILQIGEDLATSEVARSLENKWQIKGRSLKDHEIILIHPEKNPIITNPITAETRLSILGHGDINRRDGIYLPNGPLIISLIELAHQIKQMLASQNSNIGSMNNPVDIDLVSCNAGYDINGDHTSIADNLHKALLEKEIYANITARNSTVGVNFVGRKKTLSHTARDQITALAKKKNDSVFGFFIRQKISAILTDPKNYHSKKSSKFTLSVAKDANSTIRKVATEKPKHYDLKTILREKLFIKWEEYLDYRKTNSRFFTAVDQGAKKIFFAIIHTINTLETDELSTIKIAELISTMVGSPKEGFFDELFYFKMGEAIQEIKAIADIAKPI